MIAPLFPFSLLILFLLSATPTFQLLVVFSWYHMTQLHFHNVPPGSCCRAVLPAPPRERSLYPEWVRIDEVYPNGISALWQASGGTRDCSSTPVRTMTAPPSAFLTLDRGGERRLRPAVETESLSVYGRQVGTLAEEYSS